MIEEDEKTFKLTFKDQRRIINKEITLLDLVVEKQEEIERLHSIIKEVREILKFHLSNPSGTKNGWHIDIWNSEDISKLNEDLEILDKENK